MRGPSGATPLFLALMNRHYGVQLALLRAGADPNISARIDGTPAHIAVLKENWAGLKILLEASKIAAAAEAAETEAAKAAETAAPEAPGTGVAATGGAAPAAAYAFEDEDGGQGPCVSALPCRALAAFFSAPSTRWTPPPASAAAAAATGSGGGATNSPRPIPLLRRPRLVRLSPNACTAQGMTLLQQLTAANAAVGACEPQSLAAVAVAPQRTLSWPEIVAAAVRRLNAPETAAAAAAKPEAVAKPDKPEEAAADAKTEADAAGSSSKWAPAQSELWLDAVKELLLAGADPAFAPVPHNHANLVANWLRNCRVPTPPPPPPPPPQQQPSSAPGSSATGTAAATAAAAGDAAAAAAAVARYYERQRTVRLLRAFLRAGASPCCSIVDGNNQVFTALTLATVRAFPPGKATQRNARTHASTHARIRV